MLKNCQAKYAKTLHTIRAQQIGIWLISDTTYTMEACLSTDVDAEETLHSTSLYIQTWLSPIRVNCKYRNIYKFTNVLICDKKEDYNLEIVKSIIT